jgi:hypothetical protein
MVIFLSITLQVALWVSPQSILQDKGQESPLHIDTPYANQLNKHKIQLQMPNVNFCTKYIGMC